MIMITPRDADPGGEAKAKRTLDSVAGLVAATITPNMVYSMLFEHEEHVNESKSFVPSDSFRAEGAYRAPELERFALLRNATDALAGC